MEVGTRREDQTPKHKSKAQNTSGCRSSVSSSSQPTADQQVILKPQDHTKPHSSLLHMEMLAKMFLFSVLQDHTDLQVA